jgi:hypothetical protein
MKPARWTAVLAALAIAGCAPLSSSSGSGTSSGASVPAPGTAASTASSAQAQYPASWGLPDRTLTPGALQVGYTIRDICPHVNPALEALRPSSEQVAAMYRAYGITHRSYGQYEADHLVPVELLGLASGGTAADPTLNLWPEVNDRPDPAMIAKYRLSPGYVHNSKDLEEDVLHADVCSGKVPLATAQHAIATDWRQAYVTYVGTPPAH